MDLFQYWKPDDDSNSLKYPSWVVERIDQWNAVVDYTKIQEKRYCNHD